MLAVDIGNTNITLGAFPARGPAVGGAPSARVTGRLSTHRHTTADEYGLALTQFLAHADLSLSRLAGVAVDAILEQGLELALRGLQPAALPGRKKAR